MENKRRKRRRHELLENKRRNRMEYLHFIVEEGNGRCFSSVTKNSMTRESVVDNVSDIRENTFTHTHTHIKL